MRYRRLPLPFLAACLTLTSSASGGVLVVDDFSADQGLLVSLGAPASSGAVDLDVLGGERDIEVAGDGTSTSGALVGSGLLECGAIGSGTCLIMYDGNDGNASSTGLDTDGLGGLDLATDSDALLLRIESSTQPSLVRVRAYSGDTDVSELALDLPATALPRTLVYPYAEFTTVAGAGADFAGVGALTVEISGNTNVFVDQIETARLAAVLWSHYPFDGNADDVSGNARDGSVFAGAAFEADGILGGALDVTDNDGWVEIPALPAQSTGCSATFWARIDSFDPQWTTGANTILQEDLGGAAGSGDLTVRLDTSSRRLEPLESGYEFSAPSVTPSAWAHFAVVYRPDRTDFYLNGEPQDALVAPLSEPTTCSQGQLIHVGAAWPDSMDNRDFFDGQIDDLRLYTGSLTATEVQEIYSQTNAVSNGRWLFGLGDVPIEDGEFELSRSGVDQLFRLWPYRRSTDSPTEIPFPEPSTILVRGNTAVLSWGDLVLAGDLEERVAVDMIVKVTDCGQDTCLSDSLPAEAAQIEVSFQISNTTAAQADLELFLYQDYDLGGVAAQHVARQRQTIVLDGLEPIANLEVRQGATAVNFVPLDSTPSFEVAEWPLLENLLEDGEATDLANEGLPFGPGNFTHAYQWTFQLEPLDQISTGVLGFFQLPLFVDGFESGDTTAWAALLP